MSICDKVLRRARRCPSLSLCGNVVHDSHWPTSYTIPDLTGGPSENASSESTVLVTQPYSRKHTRIYILPHYGQAEWLMTYYITRAKFP